MISNDYNNFNITVSDVEYALEKEAASDWRYECASRPCCGLIYVLDGKAEYFSHAETATLCKDNVVYLSKESNYCISCVDGEVFKYIIISFNIESDTVIPLQTLPRVVHSARLLEAFKQIVYINSKKGVAHKLFSSSTVQLIIYYLLNDTIYENNYLKDIYPAIEYIENNYQHTIDIGCLSALTHMNISMFRNKFKAYTGLSPLKYINHLRIEKAKDMLKSGLYTQTEIANACGFNNVSYFNTLFSKMTGVSPGKY
ncbi:MAG: helix-turn-helix transcriptional regulator [Clostridia bacterium]|nr:helix-turn-helix transcriptional regulator [Clostridia bacterium]